ncbi:TIGR01906 family membrane protein [Clostridium tyrobutyricum]|uniref:TIGR01906 family membrane protein n=1 Tax=Clostridium tyrobutyricum TaxID=1519 RepID=UPI002B208FB9|nr:TIGR01906 family membrane protein [Clostridium tyrobutyricum]MEA5009051.1 TIGR01906 family membrane protein [Clostridium tyrobutyricum]
MNQPVYVHKINTGTKKQYKTLQILFAFSLSLFIILASVKLTLMIKPLYYFDIEYLSIENQSDFSKAEIVKNYDYVINYMLSPKVQEFKLPSIPYSKYGQIHFKDVKRIFTTIDILLIITGFLSTIGLTINIRRKTFYFIKQTSSMLILLPIVLLTALVINFDRAFVLFHKIFFRNDYWQFDPAIDPIINILPQEFFYHSALLIIILIVLSSIVLKILYKRLTIRKQV